MVKAYQHAPVLEMDNAGKRFASRGLHLNGQVNKVLS
jgi:hypothetical protein